MNCKKNKDKKFKGPQGKERLIFGKDIGKYKARKSGNIRPRNWDTSEKETREHQAIGIHLR